MPSAGMLAYEAERASARFDWNGALLLLFYIQILQMLAINKEPFFTKALDKVPSLLFCHGGGVHASVDPI